MLGPSGSGKSTLALCLDGLVPHAVESRLNGSATVAGLVVADHPVHRLAREVGLVFQDPNLSSAPSRSKTRWPSASRMC